jgi:transposase-like protein
MERRRLSDYKVKKIISHFCVDVDATKASLLLGMSRGTLNRYYLLFRQLIWHQRFEEKRLLVGVVEVDESYFGRGRPRGVAGPLKRGRGTLKQPVFGIFERNGQVYTEIVPDCKKKTLHDIILGRVSLDSAIHSDSWRGYDGLVDVGFDKHLRVRHGQNEFSQGHGVHINGIESFWSFTKRRLSKFNGIPAHMFELHLKECEWRWNRKPKELEQELFKLFKTLQVSNSLNSSDDYSKILK